MLYKDSELTLRDSVLLNRPKTIHQTIHDKPTRTMCYSLTYQLLQIDREGTGLPR